MSELFEFKCPNCGGALSFDSSVQKLKCPYCDTEIDVEALSGYDEELNASGEDQMHWEGAGNHWEAGETDGMKVYVCNSCGGEIICDESTAAATCPYCDNPVVMKGNFTGDLKPDCVIPFQYDKEAAKKAYLKHLEGKKLLPRVFRDENHIDEIKGVYVPFWLFDCDVEAHMQYKGTKTRRWADRNYTYTETSYYGITRGGTLGFDHVPADGSLAMPDELMESLEPFDRNGAVDFKTAYMAGYMADKYTVSAEDTVGAVNARIKSSTERAFYATVRGYETVQPEGGRLHLLDGKAEYALYPVWILNTTWKGQKYTFAMNGQTGKMVGDLPVDKGAFWRNLFTKGGLTAAIIFLGSYAAYLFM